MSKVMHNVVMQVEIIIETEPDAQLHPDTIYNELLATAQHGRWIHVTRPQIVCTRKAE